MKDKQLNKSFISAAKPPLRSFTLLELIVVIVILGILATLGYTQYTKVVEKGRIAEVVMNLGKMRTYAIAYHLENGSFSGITSAHFGIGAGELPSSCVSSAYFYYTVDLSYIPSVIKFYASRCTSGGKSPNWGGIQYQVELWIHSPGLNHEWRCYEPSTATGLPWCTPR